MKHQLFIRFEDESGLVSWVKSGEADGSIVTGVHQGSLQDAAADAVGHHVVVIVPAEDVLLTVARVPGKKSRNLMRQAVPYMLEDQLAEDVEDLHFGLGEVDGDDVSVAIVSNEKMDDWLAQLREAGIEPHAIVPETLVLPLESDAWTMLTGLEDKLLLRNGAQSGMALDADNALPILQSALDEVAEDERPTSLAIYECGGFILDLPDLGLELTRAPVSESTLSLLAAGYQTTNPINLLQGQYSRREQIGRYWRPWKVPIGLVAALLVLQVTTSVLDYQRLSGEKTQLWNEIVATYKKAFPNETNVPYPQRQMEEHLKRLRGGGSGASAGGSFSELLAKSGQLFKATQTLDIQRLSYKDGSLDVALTIADLQKLDQLKQQLDSKAALAVEIVSAASRGKHVEARLRISEKGA